MRKIEKSITIHISPKPYQWVELYTKEDIEVSDENRDEKSKELFNKIKNESIKEAKEVLCDVGFVISSESLKKISENIEKNISESKDDNKVLISLDRRTDADEAIVDPPVLSDVSYEELNEFDINTICDKDSDVENLINSIGVGVEKKNDGNDLEETISILDSIIGDFPTFTSEETSK